MVVVVVVEVVVVVVVVVLLGHMRIGRIFRRTLQNVRVKQGADAASDHHLVTAKLQLNLNKCTTSCGRIKYNIVLLNDTSVTVIGFALSNIILHV